VGQLERRPDHRLQRHDDHNDDLGLLERRPDIQQHDDVGELERSRHERRPDIQQYDDLG
jgi:hypothetical protein